MKLDPTQLKDWQIAEEAEKNIISIERIASKLGVLDEELIKKGRYIAKLDYN